MSEAVEIEFKTLLTAAEYQQLCQAYDLHSGDFFTQKNVYYDTLAHDLKKRQAGLRIRLYAQTAEATLKTPLTEGLLETTDPLKPAAAAALVAKEQFLTEGAVVEKLAVWNIAPAELTAIADLTTRRAEFVIPEGLLAIDESWYGQQHDYELELEVNEALRGKQAFEQLLAHHKITYKPAANKIQRAVAAKWQQ